MPQHLYSVSQIIGTFESNWDLSFKLENWVNLIFDMIFDIIQLDKWDSGQIQTQVNFELWLDWFRDLNLFGGLNQL